jgi:hypothetical protein
MTNPSVRLKRETVETGPHHGLPHDPGTKGEEPAFADLPDLDLTLIGTTVIDDRLVLLDYRVAGV